MKKKHVFTTILLVLVIILPFLAPVVAYQDTNPFLTSRKEAVISYLVSQLNTSNGGFSENDGSAEISTTYRAIMSLKLLNALGEISSTNTIDWIDKHRNTTNGGYTLDINDLKQVSIYATSYAMGSLIELGKSSEIQSDVISFINSLQNDDGGYGNKEGNQSTITSTFLALRALRSYNSMSNIDNATEYLWSRQNDNSLDENYGAFITNNSDIMYTILSSWYAVSGLHQILLESTSVSYTDALINWVASCQNLEYDTADKGGFSNNPGEDSSQMMYAYAAAGIVNILNNKSSIQGTALKTWIMNQQNTDGGFSPSGDTSDSSISTTYYALYALYYIDGNLNSLSATVPWQVVPEFSIVLIVFLIIIAAIVVVIFIKKKYY